ncbi:MAG: FkbM family methyltransferase [Lacunisphaera sp.]|nr:FkbM family methyltransferase [Lacunisphaera sp.]
MEFASPESHFTADVVQRGLLRAAPFQLMDVGCSGGIAPAWRVYEPDLRALGIDPVVTECARLSSLEKNPQIRYQPAFVGLPDDHPFNRERGGDAPTRRNPWNRLSSAAATEALAKHVAAETKLPILNTWQSEQLAPVRKYTVEELAAAEHLTSLDFLKIDIDGNDLEALLSAEKLIRESPVLGLALEVNYYGSTKPTEHTFHNTDRLMRSWGFDLFGITARTYSAGALPNRFVWDIPAQAISGRPYQGDALYLRDAVGLQGETGHPVLSPAKLLKLACLFENFSLPDFAAELVRSHGTVMGINLDRSLDLLTRSLRHDDVSYREHMQRFRENPAAFYRSGPM